MRRAFLAAAFAALVALGPQLCLAGDQGPAGARRLVSIGSAVTEIVYALGAGAEVVAVDSTSRHPEAARAVPNIGYMRRLSAEPIIALAPSLVLAVEDSGPPQAFDLMRAAGLDVRMIDDDYTPDGVAAKIATIASALGREAQGAALAASFKTALDAVVSRVASVGSKPNVLFLFAVGNGTPLAAGRDTAPDGLIRLAGGNNVFDAFGGYKPLSPEAAIGATPDVLLVTEQTIESLGGLDQLLARPELASTPAGRNRRVVAMDALLLLTFAPRTPEAIRVLAAALHPDLPGWSTEPK